jgi:hypothetical protein
MNTFPVTKKYTFLLQEHFLFTLSACSWNHMAWMFFVNKQIIDEGIAAYFEFISHLHLQSCVLCFTLLIICIIHLCIYFIEYIYIMLMPVAERFKGRLCGRSVSEVAVSNPRQGHGCLSLLSVLCCQVEVCATGRSLVQRSPADCVVSLCMI